MQQQWRRSGQQKERQGEKLMVLRVSRPFECQSICFAVLFFFESHPVYDQTQGTGAVLVLLLVLEIRPSSRQLGLKPVVNCWLTLGYKLFFFPKRIIFKKFGYSFKIQNSNGNGFFPLHISLKKEKKRKKNKIQNRNFLFDLGN